MLRVTAALAENPFRVGDGAYEGLDSRLGVYVPLRRHEGMGKLPGVQCTSTRDIRRVPAAAWAAKRRDGWWLNNDSEIDTRVAGCGPTCDACRW